MLLLVRIFPVARLLLWPFVLAQLIRLSFPVGMGAMHGRTFGPFEILSRLSDCLSVRCTGLFLAKTTNTHVNFKLVGGVIICLVACCFEWAVSISST